MERVFEDFPYLTHAAVPELSRFREEVSDALVREHAAWVPQGSGSHNFRTSSDHPFFERLYSRFYFECLAWFERFTVHPDNHRAAYVYVQTATRGSPHWHDHLRTSSISGVYYLAVPDPRGEIWFRRRDRIRKVSPKEGHLYLFPRWLPHKPMPQEAHEHRISINVELLTIEIPVARDGTRW